MKTGAEGFQQCYNAQVAVDGEHRLIVATELTSNASDQGEMTGLLDEVKETAQPETVLPATAMSGTCRSSKRGVSTGMWRRGGRGKRRRAATRTRTRRHTGWSRSWRHQRGGSGTRNASGCAQWLDQGSPWLPAIQRAGQGARGMGPGMSGTEHQAPATASGSVRAPARQRDMAGITPVGRLAGRLGPSRGPCAPLRTPAPRCSCPSSHRSRPVHPLACPVFLQRKLLAALPRDPDNPWVVAGCKPGSHLTDL